MIQSTSQSRAYAAAGVFAALLAVAVTLPAVSHAQTKLRIQSAFPAKGTFADNLVFFAERVKVMSGGRLEIEPLATGSVVPAFDVLDATNKKVLDGAHSSSAYWVGKNRAAALFGVTPGGPFGMDGFDYMGWLYDGGGLELYREFFQVVLKQNVVPIPMTSAGPQAMGWFKRPVKSWADLKGLKCRQTGISAEVFSKSGMATVNIPGNEILAAGERGVIDCAEWVGPSDDMLIGFHTVWKHFYTQSLHDLSLLEILINGDVWKSLSPDLQAIMQAAAIEATLRSQNRRNRLDAAALVELKNEARRHCPSHARRYPEEDARELGRDRQGGGGEEPVLRQGVRVAARLRLPGGHIAPHYGPTLQLHRRLLLAGEEVATGKRGRPARDARVLSCRIPQRLAPADGRARRCRQACTRAARPRRGTSPAG